MKKIVYLVLIGTILLYMLIGCGLHKPRKQKARWDISTWDTAKFNK